MIAPVLEQMAKEQDGRLRIAKLDVDKNPQTATKFGVMSIPTLILFKDGKPVERLVGYMPKDRLWDRIKEHVAEPAAKK
jgi:thioredoxin 1